MRYDFTDRNGTFLATDTGDTSYLYLPVASPSGVLSCITPTGRGDSRLSQNQYLLPPVVVEDLQQSMVGRNFWFDIENVGLRSASDSLWLSLPESSLPLSRAACSGRRLLSRSLTA